MSMNSSDFNKILKSYDIKQARNKQIQKDRQRKLFDAIPALLDIHQNISKVSMASITSAMDHPDKQEQIKAELKKDLAALTMQKKSLLIENGYKEDYLDPVYDCKDCEDTGYIGNDKCHCLKQAIIDYSYEQSNLKAVLDRENFSTFSFDFYSKDKHPRLGISPYDNMRSVHQICLDFVDNFHKEFSNLILYGHSGLGKTFLCNAIAKEILDSGYTVIYLSAFQLFRLFENYRFHKDEEIVTNDDIENIFHCDLLIIDDLGTEFNNSLTKAELFNCLNTRLLNEKSTVISTNLSPNEWGDNYSERITSRIFGYYTQLMFIGSDIRMDRYN